MVAPRGDRSPPPRGVRRPPVDDNDGDDDGDGDSDDNDDGAPMMTLVDLVGLLCIGHVKKVIIPSQGY
jgi:hypothetical protein